MSSKAPGWARKYRNFLWLADGSILVIAGLIGFTFVPVSLTGAVTGDDFISRTGIPYGLFLGLVVILWLVVLENLRTRSPAVIGRGSAEYVGVLNSSFAVFLVISAVSFLGRAEPSRLLVATFLVSAVVLLLVGRFIARRILWLLREHGRALSRIHLVGARESLEGHKLSFERKKTSGYRVVGRSETEGVSQLATGELERITGELRMRSSEIDVVLITNPQAFSATELESFAAKLEIIPLQLAVLGGAEELATARLRFSSEPRSNFLRVRDVELGTLALLAKRAVDVVFSLTLLVVLAPVFLVVGLLIKFDSRGPVFFVQQRVGQYGKVFPMVKFRSMVPDAENKLSLIRGKLRNAGNDVLTKSKMDPRVTRTGAFLRRWSIDELPQLFNVLVGHMSLVGPRPPLASEVDQYDGVAHLRLAAIPGITGLWQVSGRSDLSWEDSVRLDLEYVENWSPLVDVIILLRTIPAVLKRTGAY